MGFTGKSVSPIGHAACHLCRVPVLSQQHRRLQQDRSGTRRVPNLPGQVLRPIPRRRQYRQRGGHHFRSFFLRRSLGPCTPGRGHSFLIKKGAAGRLLGMSCRVSNARLRRAGQSSLRVGSSEMPPCAADHSSGDLRKASTSSSCPGKRPSLRQTSSTCHQVER